MHKQLLVGKTAFFHPKLESWTHLVMAIPFDIITKAKETSLVQETEKLHVSQNCKEAGGGPSDLQARL